jgi:hypothetical protein
MPKIKHRFTIDRKRWARGQHKDPVEKNPGVMMNQRGKMCPIGFYLTSLGAEPATLKGVSRPDKPGPLAFVEKKAPWLLKKYDRIYVDGVEGAISMDVTTCSPDAFEIMSLNDDSDVSSDEREQEIADLFRQNGVQVRFTG